MKCSLGISNFLEEISSISHSILLLYFFALITEECFLISPYCSLELCIQMGISFLSSFVWCCSNFEEMPHIPGQRKSPSKMVGGAKSCLESNIPARDIQRAQTNLVCTRTQKPTEIEPELCLSVSGGGPGQQRPAAGALGAADLGMA